MKKLILSIMLFLFISACSSRAPEPEPDLNEHLQNSDWTIQSVDLKLKNLRGTCDFSLANVNSYQITSSDSNEGHGVFVQRLYDSEPDGCRFEALSPTGNFSPAPNMGGIFEIKATGASTLEFQYNVGTVAPAKTSAEKEKYKSYGWTPVFEQKRMMANETPYMIDRNSHDDSVTRTAKCSRFETSGRISSRKKVVTCFLPRAQGWIKLQERN